MSGEGLIQRILEFVQADGYEPRGLERLALALGIGEAERGSFHDACKALMKTGRVALGAGQALMLAGPPPTLVGTFRANPRGFGFIIPNTPNLHGDLYVPGHGTAGAITGDVVRARVRKKGKRQGKMLLEGKIEEIIQRGRSQFVGMLTRQGSRWYLIPDGNTLHTPILVDDVNTTRGKDGDQVVVEMLKYPEGGSSARGVIIKVLGVSGQPDVDTQSIIEQHQLPDEFPEPVRAAARAAVDRFDVRCLLKDREDLRKETIITIDPPDAKDYDDAISLTERADGTFELGVHIADVAYFVEPDSPVDEEARRRGNSIYLPGLVLPMLPETLSNGVCSLQERQPRATKSALITYSKSGSVIQARAANTVIASSKRLSYPDADRILSGRPGRMSAKVVALIDRMARLARLIHRRRLRKGALELDLPEIELIYDDRGRAIDAKPADQCFPHKIIEMFMVEANEAVARLLAKAKVPFLRRIHPEPAALASGNSRRLLELLGYELSEEPGRKEVQKLLKRAAGRPEAFAVNLSILRTMQPAEYAPEAIGHYALASDNYCHFTSPIRRYPDLTIHRLLDDWITRKSAPVDVKDDQRLVRLSQLGRACSHTERRAEAAERELRLVQVLRLLDQHVGDAYDGMVTGVANVGVFVQLDRWLVDGLLPFDQLGDDWWELDAGGGRVVGERSGCQVCVGDRVGVLVASVSVPQRKLGLALSSPLTKGRGKTGSRNEPRTGKTPRRRSASRTSKAAQSAAGKPTARKPGVRKPGARRAGGRQKGGGGRRSRGV